MCYKIITHSLRCDVRSFISDGSHDIVNGYAAPTKCACAPGPEIASYLRCEDHGCCRISTRIQRCAFEYNPCPEAKIKAFHFYERAHSTTTPWAPAAILDGEVHASKQPTAIEGADWRAAFDHLLQAGARTKKSQSLMKAVQAEVRVMGMVHAMDHGLCTDCPRAVEIAFLREAGEVRRQEIAGLVGQFKFGAWFVCRGEIKGGRAVSGLAVPEEGVTPVHKIPFK